MHISKNGPAQVEAAIKISRPDVVAVELCVQRYAALASGQKPSLLQLASSPFYTLLYLAQQTLGAILGAKPGAEMIAAISVAKQHKIPLLLADVEVSKTLSCIKSAPLKEKLSLLLPSKGKVSLNFADLGAITDEKNLVPLLGFFKNQLPMTYACVIDGRNAHMFAAVASSKASRVLLVTGAGHAPGIKMLIAKHNIGAREQITYKTLKPA